MLKKIPLYAFLLFPYQLIAMHCFVPQKSQKNKTAQKKQQIATDLCITGIREASIKKITKGLKMGAPINSSNRANDLVYMAAIYGNGQALKFFLDNTQADVNRHAIMHHALIIGVLNCIPLLLQHPTRKINIFYHDATPLHLAINYGHNDIINLLLGEPDIDINIRRLDNGCSPLHCACTIGNNLAITNLIAKGADPLSFNKDKLTPLASAFVNGTINAISEEPLTYMIHKKDTKGNTQLHVCAKAKITCLKTIYEYVGYLVNNGVSIWSKNKKGLTAFECAFRRYNYLFESYHNSIFLYQNSFVETQIAHQIFKRKLSAQRKAALSLFYVTNKKIEYALFGYIFPLKDINKNIMFQHYLIDLHMEKFLRTITHRKNR